MAPSFVERHVSWTNQSFKSRGIQVVLAYGSRAFPLVQVVLCRENQGLSPYPCQQAPSASRHFEKVASPCHAHRVHLLAVESSPQENLSVFPPSHLSVITLGVVSCSLCDLAQPNVFRTHFSSFFAESRT